MHNLDCSAGPAGKADFVASREISINDELKIDH